MAKEYDLVVLGGGTGGYVAAIRAAQLGMVVAIVEKDKLGGTCLHKGCIPSKALLRSAEMFQDIKQANEFGIETSKPELNFTKVQSRKETIVEELYSGVQFLMKKGKIDVYEGYGRLLGPSIFSPLAGTISIEHTDERENTMIVPENVIVATGSRPKTLPNLNIDEDYVLSSEEALRLTKLPNSIIIIGGGVIGVEWASMLADFDVEVTLIEYDKNILPSMDSSIQKELEKQLKSKGVTIICSAQVLPETIEKNSGVQIDYRIDEETTRISADKILVSVGRRANVEGIGLDNTDIRLERNFIKTNEYYQTKESHIYAIGDCIGGLQLAHMASHEGIVAVEHMNDMKPEPIDINTVASCVYSNPEAAMVGLTEQKAKKLGYKFKVGTFPFKANGKALVHGQVAGFVKIITDEDTEDIIGIHMVGPDVTNMISEASLAKYLDATAWEMASTIHPHPTLSEVIGEAALAVEGKQIHG